MITALIAAASVVLGGFLARSVDITSYIQSNAKAHSDVDAFKRELASLTTRFTKIESSQEQLKANNTSLMEQNRILLHQNNELHLMNQELTKQNGLLLVLLGGVKEQE